MPEDSTRKHKRRGNYEYHGMSSTPEYKTWVGMIGRCHNPAHPFFAYYGGRGIEVCPQWKESFIAFYTCVGPRPHFRDTIERIDNSKGYEPSNVRWATRKEQADNRRQYANAVQITRNGETRSMAEWARHLNISYQVLYHRWLRSPDRDILLLATQPPRSLGENHFAARFTEMQVREMRRLHSSGECNYSEIGRRFKIDRRHARSIVIGQCYKFVT